MFKKIANLVLMVNLTLYNTWQKVNNRIKKTKKIDAFSKLRDVSVAREFIDNIQKKLN